MKTLYYIAALFCIIAGLASACWRKWDRAAFWIALAIWLNMP